MGSINVMLPAVQRLLNMLWVSSCAVHFDVWSFGKKEVMCFCSCQKSEWNWKPLGWGIASAMRLESWLCLLEDLMMDALMIWRLSLNLDYV
jgi:hypothetical protein